MWEKLSNEKLKIIPGEQDQIDSKVEGRGQVW